MKKQCKVIISMLPTILAFGCVLFPPISMLFAAVGLLIAVQAAVRQQTMWSYIDVMLAVLGFIPSPQLACVLAIIALLEWLYGICIE